MKGISTIIDANTRVARSMVATSLREYTASGYLVFAVNGKLQERRIAFSTKENCRYIVFKKEAYKIDLPAKPISGGYNVESLYERPPYTA
ncbi:hypothetical protein DIDNDMLP_00242 [Klebsiella phage KP13-7]|nr:hypothetical protein DIDNDMLP_00242 [Klebsiella phage KP13-7]